VLPAHASDGIVRPEPAALSGGDGICREGDDGGEDVTTAVDHPCRSCGEVGARFVGGLCALCEQAGATALVAAVAQAPAQMPSPPTAPPAHPGPSPSGNSPAADSWTATIPIQWDLEVSADGGGHNGYADPDHDWAAEIEEAFPATFGQRLAARLIDAVILTVSLVVMYATLFISISSFGNIGGALGGLIFGPLLIIVGSGIASLLYLQKCDTNGGMTLGRAAVGIRLVNLKTEPGRTDKVRGWQAYWRRVAENFGELFFGLAAFSMLWDPDKRTWGDKVSGTAVIQSRNAAGPGRGLRAGAIATFVTAAACVASVAIFSGGSSLNSNTNQSSYDPNSSTTFANTGTTDTSGTSSVTVDPSQSTQVANSVSVQMQAPNGVDDAGNAVSYSADNMLDNDPSTAWRVAGDGSGQDITIILDGTKAITQLGLINGYAKTDPSTDTHRYAQERQITQVTWKFDDGTTYNQSLRDDESMQLINLDTPASTGNVTLHIDSTSTPGDSNFDYTAISEIVVNGQ
jgi:uncharacterized RDD family membrane protein YckC